MGVISLALRPGFSLWSQVAKRRASCVYKAIVFVDRSGRRASVSCQAAISCHMTPPCYRHSSIIGAVFHKIDRGTLPIIYHLGGKTVPISPFCGTVRLIEPGTRWRDRYHPCKNAVAVEIISHTTGVLCGSVFFLFSDSSEARFPRTEHGLNTISDLQLAVYLADVITHRFGAEDQALGNSRIGESLGDEGQHLAFPLA